MREPFVRLVGITKQFPGVTANDRVDLAIHAGEVHALLGENGSGKTTLMSILAGVLRPDGGEILLGGSIVHFNSPLDAIRRGIGMVHQDFTLAVPMTVAENVTLGKEITRAGFLRPKDAERWVQRCADEYGMTVDPHARVEQLSVGEQQRVEILKVLFRGVELIILDEPTAVLTPTEAARLFATLAAMAQRGKAVVFITHKLREVLAISDQITVLRQGRVVGAVRTTEASLESLAQMMVGRQMAGVIAKEPSGRSGAILDVQDLHVLSDRQVEAVRGVSLRVQAAEVVGLAGVDGNGQQELVEAITGLRRASSGRVQMGDSETTRGSARRFHKLGGAHIPSDRRRVGSLADFTVAENLILRRHDRSPFARGGLLHRPAVEQHAERKVLEYDIRGPSVNHRAGLLSGGNLQKLILARELDGGPSLIVAAHPTRGLDIAATQFVHDQFIRARNGGTGILLVSADLDEILALSDRILVMYEGRIVGEVWPGPVARDRAGLLMAGVTEAAQ